MLKKKICVVTGTRAEYHLLYPLLKAMKEDKEFDLILVVTGAHLSPKYGNTYKDIEKDGFKIDAKIPILYNDDNESRINFAIGRAVERFSLFFEKNIPDMVVLLGDRYELLSVAIVAMNFQIPIAHLHGGETTEGAIDECIRHAITKMSYLHFTSCEVYRKRVIQLGEDPSRVFNVGAIGLENIKNLEFMTREELKQDLKFDFGEHLALITFHPVTLEKNTAEKEFRELLEAIKTFKQLKIIFTKANADSGGLCINQMIDEYVKVHSNNSLAVFSLGMVRYLSALNCASVVIGNSSSGIVETPSFGVPTVNIGDRQRGRIQAQNIINCIPQRNAIVDAIEKALSKEFSVFSKEAVNPYGDGVVTPKIMYHIRDFLDNGKIDLKKSFYDIRFEEDI